MAPWSRKLTPNHNSALREALFGDIPLSTWAARAKGEPWDSFSSAAEFLAQGNRTSAMDVLQSIVRRPGLESRHYLEAWLAIREAGGSPTSDEAKRIYGVVVDVPMELSFDTLAAYEDRRARYLNYSGAAIIWEAPTTQMDGYIVNLLSAGQILAKLIGPWEGQRPPLAPGQARISMLTPSGLHFGQGPFDTLSRDSMAAPLIQAATELMRALFSLTAEENRAPGLP